MVVKKEVAIWRLWGSVEPMKSLVRNSDHSFSLATWDYTRKRGGIYIPSTKERKEYKTYTGWLEAAKQHFTIKNKTIAKRSPVRYLGSA